MTRRPKQRKAIWNGQIVKRAIVDSFVKLNPRKMMGNPVMFVVEVGSVLTTLATRSRNCCADSRRDQHRV